MFDIDVMPIDRRHKRCKCKEPCGFIAQFKNVYGEVEHTMCMEQAKLFAMSILDKLIRANSDLVQVRKDKNRDKRWAEDEVVLLHKYRERGLTYGQIAIKLGRTTTAVKKKLDREGKNEEARS